MKDKRIILSALVVATVVAYSQGAHAALGGNADTVTSDEKALSAVRHSTTQQDGYTVVEVVSGSSAVREYLSPAGIVFGIAWNGYVNPDLTHLLGSYAGEYSAALQKAPRTHGQRHQRLVTDNLVVEKWGHMRDLRGRAYVQGLVPSGVTIDEIK